MGEWKRQTLPLALPIEANQSFAGGSLADDVLDFFKAFGIESMIKPYRKEKLVVLLAPKKERDEALKKLRATPDLMVANSLVMNSGLFHVVPFSHFSAAIKSCSDYYKSFDAGHLVRMGTLNGQYIDYMCGLGHTKPGWLWVGDFQETIKGPVEKNAKMNPVDLPAGYPSMIYVVRLKRFLPAPPPNTFYVTSNLSATEERSLSL